MPTVNTMPAILKATSASMPMEHITPIRMMMFVTSAMFAAMPAIQ